MSPFWGEKTHFQLSFSQKMNWTVSSSTDTQFIAHHETKFLGAPSLQPQVTQFILPLCSNQHFPTFPPNMVYLQFLETKECFSTALISIWMHLGSKIHMSFSLQVVSQIAACLEADLQLSKFFPHSLFYVFSPRFTFLWINYLIPLYKEILVLWRARQNCFFKNNYSSSKKMRELFS